MADEPEAAGPNTLEHLRGRRLVEAIDDLVGEINPGAWPMHYRDLHALLERRGYRVGGRDPLATFLTALTRADGIEAVGQRSGLYRLPEVES